MPLLDQLSAAYMQKVREAGDPSYYRKVEGLLARALSLSPTDVDALWLRGSLELGRHQFSAALDWGGRAVALAPRSSQALGVVADAQTELGQYDAAVATLQRMVDAHPDLGSYSRISYARELRGDVPGAITAMQMALTAGASVPENVAYIEVLLGNLYFNSGRLAEAEAQYQASLQAFAGYIHGEAALARLRAAQGRFADSIKLSKKVLDVFPSPEYVIALGDVYSASGDAAGAARTYDLAAAEQQLFQGDGVNVDAELALFAADHDRDLAAALAAAQRAAHDRPNVITDDVLGWTLYKTGDLGGALAASQRARRLGTQDALIFFHAGMIESKLAQSEQGPTDLTNRARSDLAHALAINQHFHVLHAAQAQRTLDGLAGAA